MIDEKVADAAWARMLKASGVETKIDREIVVATIREHVSRSLDEFYSVLCKTEPFRSDTEAVRGLILTLFGKTMAATIERQVQTKLALAAMSTKGTA